ncbi:hypothetical protein DPQ33_07435 [Oceanidesulfovibrio indonesiensis]|uniref:histidine kinase n=1 Tax=Oceanidesulfovibrio indonesiensis TaxID=54767 RepID=A0A7M3MGQ4_9BACT|nr:PAS domain-containing sensor histidine kinase [Oceanidesulfovibrio indonesiensis]TVM17933.1 hypothetical protein DPQ33_07435 [Oceanidesulfovibrio indonesiensis]
MSNNQAIDDTFHQSLFRAIFEKAPIGVFTSRPDGKNFDANPALAAMLGYESPQATRANLSEIATQIFHNPNLPIEDVEVIQKAPDLVMLSYEYARPDGSSFTAFLHICTVHEPYTGTPYILGLVEDITDAHDLQKKLRESEQRYRSVFENAPVGIYQSTVDGHYLNVNPEFARMHGYATPQELIDDVRDSSRQLYADPNRRLQLLKILQEKNAATNFEALSRRKDGSTFWTMRNVRLMCDAEGKPIHIKGFVTDISERKQLEAMREDVERIIRHDLKSPVIAMLAGLKMLSWRDSFQEDQDLVHELQETAQRMLAMLDLSSVLYKIEQGIYDYETRPVDVVSLLGDIADSLLTFHASKRIAMHVQPREITECHIMGEPLLMRTALENLLKNALEATPDLDEVTVRITVDTICTIAIHNAQPVPEAVRDRFFEKYATAGKTSGTGLGTYSAKMCTEAMGGCTEMTTSDDEGTTVVVQFPLA